MTDLRIVQNNNIETVTLSVLNKLYETVYSLGTGHAYINGNISTQSAYRDDVTYLTNRFNGGSEGTLNITVAQWYIKFTSLDIQSFLATKIGDGTGVTETQASTSMIGGQNGWFNGWTKSLTFPEFKYFTATLRNWSLSSGSQGATFQNWKGLTSIDCGHTSENIPTRIPYATFLGCTGLTTVSGLSHVAEIAGYAFYGCSSLTMTQTDFPNLTKIGEHAFHGSSVTGAWDFSSFSPSNIGVDAFKQSGITSFKISSTFVNSAGKAPDFIDNCNNLTTFLSDVENWNYMVRFVGTPNITPFVIYQPKILLFNDKAIFVQESYDGPGSWTLLYYPAVTSTVGANYFINGNQDYRTPFSNSRYYGNIQLLYFKNVQYLDTCTFTLKGITAIIIDNTTPPIIYSHNKGSDTNTVVYTFKGRDGQTDSNKLYFTFYVPDSAVNTYKSTWPTYTDRIKGISELNGGTYHYATEAAWEAAGKPVAIIDEYTVIPSI